MLLPHKNKTVFEEKAFARGYSFIAGLDEAGRGPLAGPVSAAVCCLREGQTLPDGIDDSKRLSERKREELYTLLQAQATYACAFVFPERIAEINIYWASQEAMLLALQKLPKQPQYLLVDGMDLKNTPSPAEKIIGGDAKSLLIGAASIIAKVERDRYMKEQDILYPQYGFAKHKGYPTTQHREALAKYGPCPIHRHLNRCMRDS